MSAPTVLVAVAVTLALLVATDARAFPPTPPAVASCELAYGKGRCPWFRPGWSCTGVMDERTGRITLRKETCVELWWAHCNRKVVRHSLVNGRWVPGHARRGCEDYNS